MYPPKREEGLLILHFKNFLFICGLTLIRSYKLILTVQKMQFYAADIKYFHSTYTKELTESDVDSCFGIMRAVT